MAVDVRSRVGNSSLPLTRIVGPNAGDAAFQSVTVAAGILQKAGLMDYTRGHMAMKSRETGIGGLRCYELIQRRRSYGNAAQDDCLTPIRGLIASLQSAKEIFDPSVILTQSLHQTLAHSPHP